MEGSVDKRAPDVALAGERNTVHSSGRQRAATAALLAGVMLGMLGDALFRTSGMGINLALWAASAVAATVWVSRIHQRRVSVRSWSLAVPVMFFAGVFAWRTAPALLAINLLAMLSAFGMLALAVGERDIVRASIGEMVKGALSVGISGTIGTPALIAVDRALRDGGAKPRWRTAMAIARGFLLAVPLLVVFGALLTAADPRFEQLIARIIEIDFAATAGHIVFAGFIAWIAAGYLRAASVTAQPMQMPGQTSIHGMTLGLTELATIFGLVDALFALFITMQLPHLFGGAARLRDAQGLSAAEYARGGFFQLVTVAALVLPLLLAGAALVRKGDGPDWRVFRGLAAAMIALVGLMIMSALQRLALYVAAFGLSEERVYATAAVAWLAIVFALFVGTVLRRRAGAFAFGAILSGWIILGALDVTNPQAVVVGVNLRRAASGRSFDSKYATTLDADAVPALAAGMAVLDAEGRCTVAKKLATVMTGRQALLAGDWRSWNLARATASGASRSAHPGAILAGCR